MKKLTTLLLAAVLTFGAIDAQAKVIGFGLSAGTSNAKYSIKGNDGAIENEMGFQIEASAPISLPLVSITPAINYSNNSFTVADDDIWGASVGVKSHSVDIPIMVTVPIIPIIKVEVGPRFSLYNEAIAKEDGEKMSLGRLTQKTGFSAGVNLTILKKILIGARYNGQFGGYDSSLATDNNYTMKYHSYNISLGFKF